ncbi:sugar ABC transporter substrate-binding protein [Arthrobacter sp. OAP107]|uniref:sugar ABC transporter substrate-binding protein n=1 Tax=Arthrobacter sp. OAP107 TaxID=3156445 RepID=UPI003390F7B4
MPSIESRIAEIARSDIFPSDVGRRTFLGLAAAAGVSISLSSCSIASGSKSGSDGLTRGPMAAHVTTLANEFFVEYTDGAKQAAAALKFDLTAYEEQGNVNTALGQLGTVRASGGKTMFGHNASEAECAAMVKSAAAANIFYACTFTAPPNFTPADSRTWVRFITPSTPEIAYQTAKTLFEKVGGEGTVIHVPGQKGSTPDVQRTAGLKRALKEYPNIKIVTTPDGNWTAQDARKAFENTLPSVDDFVGVFTQNDSEAEGVIAALDARGIKGIQVTGFDGNKKNIEFIADGKQLLTSATTPGLSAGLAAVSLFDAVNGVKLSLPESMLFQGAVLVNAENAADLRKKLYSGPLPFEWERMSRALHPDDWDPQTLLTPIKPQEFFADAPTGDYKLNTAWDGIDQEITQIKKKYADAFQAGPLAAYKSEMV